MKVRSLLASTALAAFGLVPMAGMAPAYAAETCDGRTATIVGTPGGSITGTNGDDVIVTNGALSVNAGFGSDTVCTTGTAAGQTVNVNVLNSSAAVVDRLGDPDPGASAQVEFAQGAFAFYGGPGPDVVDQDANGPVAAPVAIATGAGDDTVRLGQPQLLQGSVDLGAGDDSLTTFRAPRGLALAGGEGSDHLELVIDEKSTWTVDARHGRILGPNGSANDLSGFESYFLLGYATTPTLSFIGSDTSEQVSVQEVRLQRVSLGGGDDILTLGVAPMKHAAQLSGGAGQDTLEVLKGDPTVTVSLADRYLSNGTRIRSPLRGFEDATAFAGRVTLVGDGHANGLRWLGCQGGSVSGGDGDDRIAVLATDQHCHFGRVPALHAQGGPGNDLLIGGPGKDVLDGGPGRDTAKGGQNLDVCIDVEVRKSCEVIR